MLALTANSLYSLESPIPSHVVHAMVDGGVDAGYVNSTVRPVLTVWSGLLPHVLSVFTLEVIDGPRYRDRL